MEYPLVALAVAFSAAVALVLGRAVRRRLWFVTEVESTSMAPTLVPGQRLLTRRPGSARAMHRGDIVVVNSPELGRPVIKRAVGFAGERVIVGADGRIQVDGRHVAERYVAHWGGKAGVFDVPTGHLLLLGDNRAASSDARSWREPYLPESAVIGRVVRRGTGLAGALGELEP